MLLFFARHGKTVSSLSGQLKNEDEPLSDEGRAEIESAAQALYTQLGSTRLTHIISSPRRRTIETSTIFKEVLGFAGGIEIDNRLVERNCDAFAGQSIKEVFAQTEKELVAAGMEPETDVYSRTIVLWDEVSSTAHEDDVILLVGHSTAIKPLALIQKGLPLESSIELPKINPDRVWQLTT